MENSEPTLVPEWLKTSGSPSGGGNTSPQFASSSLHPDEQRLLKSGRNRPFGNTGDYDLGRSTLSDRTTSSYFRRTSSSNGSAHSRSFSSIGKNNRDKEWDRDIHDFRDKDKSAPSDHRHNNLLGDILPSRYEKDGLRRSHSSISANRRDSLSRKTASELCNGSMNNHSNGSTSTLPTIGGSSVHKAAFERDFPSLRVEERHFDPEIGRVPSPGLTVIQNLPIGNSSVIGGDVWTSALAEVPVIVASNGTSAMPVQQVIHASSVSGASNATSGRNMAETLVQGPPRVQAAPQLSVGTQRLEELAVKQSRQLIPVTPTLPKILSLNSSDKPKLKAGVLQHQNSQIVNHSPRGTTLKSEVSKVSTSLGKLHVLKPARERNGIPQTQPKESLSPTSNCNNLPESPLARVPSVVPFRNPLLLASAERKSPAVNLEKRHTAQAQSRYDFLNSLRKKTASNSSSTEADSGSSEITTEAPSVSVSYASDEPALVWRSGGELIGCNENGNGLSNGNNQPRHSEEEEAAFLRSLGWEENAAEDEGLTEEEINAFYRKATEYGKLSLRTSQGGE